MPMRMLCTSWWLAVPFAVLSSCGGTGTDPGVAAPRATSVDSLQAVGEPAEPADCTDARRVERTGPLTSPARDTAIVAIDMALTDPRTSRRLDALDAAASLEPALAIERLELALLDPEVAVRETVVEVLGTLDGPEAHALLLRARMDVDPVVREAAAEALWRRRR